MSNTNSPTTTTIEEETPKSYIKKILSQGYREAENRPWANEEYRTEIGKKGTDYVKDNKKILMRFFWNEKLKIVKGIVKFTLFCEGPPRIAHGGAIASLYDEILAYPVWRQNVSAFTGTLSVKYKTFTPLNEILYFESSVVKVEGKIYFVHGKVMNKDGKVLTECDGIWFKTTEISIDLKPKYIKNITPDQSLLRSAL